MTIEKLRADNERLATLNDRLARQIATMADTLDRSRRELLTPAQFAAVAAMTYEDGSKVEVAKNSNPYRQPVEL